MILPLERYNKAPQAAISLGKEIGRSRKRLCGGQTGPWERNEKEPQAALGRTNRPLGKKLEGAASSFAGDKQALGKGLGRSRKRLCGEQTGPWERNWKEPQAALRGTNRPFRKKILGSGGVSPAKPLAAPHVKGGGGFLMLSKHPELRRCLSYPCRGL